ncbi:RhoGAP-domain-containing protein [Corynespora cassiicola Philippines]|uniref:RhoGAP-domain-containing protein n=1 Tax=Corynespora cassiicola Philippines TaxID=1448308 RepID=A0A2T2NM82_CORCC|nr:RhoGAP-domain-containing protein [Corynespora cassiicola Philippines]
MPNGMHNHLSTPRVRNGEPQPAPPPASDPPAPSKRDLASWWKQFSKRSAKKEEEKEPEPRGIFGVPLITSIPYANVAISLFNETGESYIYGYVPIVVAKCGVFLKEKATDVEGIFRLAGSEKRIKELKIAFDTPPRWGKGLDWTGYTVHDAANILRRYFNQLPEPIIPLQHYDAFREPLRGHQAQAVGPIEGQAPSVGEFDPDQAVRIYQHLIKSLPSLNRQLLLYILDLLAVFAAKSDVNKMTTSNLAAIFQPGILSHPQHDMSPADYRLSQDVLIFLIDNQDHFLIGMEGTAVDEGTVKHVESGPSTPQAKTPSTPSRNKSGIGRSASTSSSAGAESLRKFGGIRRNVSASSRHSRHSGAIPSPTTPSFVAPSGSGVHRSNTVPSKRSPAIPGSRFTREKNSDPSTPAADDPKTNIPTVTPEVASSPPPAQPLQLVEPVPAVRPVESVQPVQEPLPIQPAPPVHPAPPAQQSQPVQQAQPAQQASKQPAHEPPLQAYSSLIPPDDPPEALSVVKPEPEAKPTDVKPAAITPALDTIPGAFPFPSPGIIPPSTEVTPTAPSQAVQELGLPAPQQLDQRSPHLTPTREKSEFMEGPVDSGPSVEPTPAVRTFTQILAKVSPSGEEKQPGRKPNKLQKKRLPTSANPSAHSSTHSLTGGHAAFDGPPSPLPYPHPPAPQHPATSSKEVLQSFNADTVSSRNSGATLKPTMSPSASFRSHSTATEYSEAEHPDEPPREEKRSFWKSHKRGESKATPTASQTDLHGSVPGADKSMSSFGSSSGWPAGRRSLQHDSHQNSDLSQYSNADMKEAGEKKGPLDWFQRKRQEHKERVDKKNRAKSPPGSSHDLMAPQSFGASSEGLPVRGKSMDIPRTASEGSSDITPTGPSTNPLPLAPSIPQTQPLPMATPTPSNSHPAADSPSDPPANPST